MSIEVTTAVWKFSKQKSGSLLVLLAIADYANQLGIAWPSVATLAAKTRMSDRNVQRWLRKLQQDGELEIRRKQGPYGTNHLIIKLSSTTNTAQLANANDARVVKFAPPMSQKGDVGVTRSVIDPSKEPSSTPIVPKGDEDDLKFWIEICFKCFGEAPRPVPNRILRTLKNSIHRLDRRSATLLIGFYRRSFDDKFPFFTSRVHSPERLMLRLEAQLALAVRAHRS